MNIIVCIKQVPGTTKVQVDPETGILKRDGTSAKINPYDLYALETALRLKEQFDAHVTAITMGPLQAQAIIREAYMMGVDQGFLLSDIKFAGSDVLATSYTLACGIRKIGTYDLIICGKQTTDGDTAQVGPSIAEHLSIPHVTCVKDIVSTDKTGIVVEQNMDDRFIVARLSFPCLLTVEKDIFTPRLPSYLLLKKTKDWQVPHLALPDLPDDAEKKCGLTGSPTQVECIFPPESNMDHVIWDACETDCAEMLYNLLVSEKFT